MKLMAIIVRCVCCGEKKTLTEPPTDQPVCPKCYGPMIVDEIRAKAKRVKP